MFRMAKTAIDALGHGYHEEVRIISSVSRS